MLVDKAGEKDRLGSGGNKKRKYDNGIRNTPLSIHSKGTNEDKPLGSVILQGLSI